MTEGPQKFFLTCPECSDRVLVVIPEDGGQRAERTTTCSNGHSFSYDERTVLGRREEEPAQGKEA